MRSFDYQKEPEKLLTPEVVRLLGSLHEYKGKQSFLLGLRGEELFAMRDQARSQSARSTAEAVHRKGEKPSDPERYLRCLDRIREHFNELSPDVPTLFALHASLYDGEEDAGLLRNTDQVITELDRYGQQSVRFYPPPAGEVEEELNVLCDSFSRAMDAGETDPLLLIPMFVVDFLCIHPFRDGNGRLSYLLQTLLLYRSGYYVNAYVSMERMIEETRQGYVQALLYSSIFWNDGTNSYEPFVLYFLETLCGGCRRFELQTHYLYGKKKSKSERVREVIDRWPGAITKREILEQCPDIAQVTVERALTALVKAGVLEKTGGGPATAYIKRMGR
jgi:Fic family protein